MIHILIGTLVLVKRKEKSQDHSRLPQFNYTMGVIHLRLQNVHINPATMKLEVDIMEQKGSFAIVGCDGNARLTQLPDDRETKIVSNLFSILFYCGFYWVRSFLPR